MSWHDAPLYVEAYALACWVTERTAVWAAPHQLSLGRLTTREASELVCSAALALTFPRSRAEHLRRADHAIVRLRIQLRLARDMGLISAGGLRYACGRLREIGRMVGGWRRRVERQRAVAAHDAKSKVKP